MFVALNNEFDDNNQTVVKGATKKYIYIFLSNKKKFMKIYLVK